MLEREQGTREKTPPPPPPPPKKPNFVNVFGIFPRVFFSFYSPSSAHTQPCYQRSSFLNFSFIFVREEKAERKRKGVFFFLLGRKTAERNHSSFSPPSFVAGHSNSFSSEHTMLTLPSRLAAPVAPRSRVARGGRPAVVVAGELYRTGGRELVY